MNFDIGCGPNVSKLPLQLTHVQCSISTTNDISLNKQCARIFVRWNILKALKKLDNIAIENKNINMAQNIRLNFN